MGAKGRHRIDSAFDKASPKPDLVEAGSAEVIAVRENTSTGDGTEEKCWPVFGAARGVGRQRHGSRRLQEESSQSITRPACVPSSSRRAGAAAPAVPRMKPDQDLRRDRE